MALSDKKDQKEIFENLLKDYKKKIIEEDGLGIKKGDIAEYPNQVSPRTNESSSYQSEKI